MLAPALYGALLGGSSVLFTKVLPQPGGSVVFWALMALQLARGAVLVWRRTGLLVTTMNLTIGAVMMASLAILAATGQVYPAIPSAWWILFLMTAPAGLALLLIESKLNPDALQRWREHQQNATLWDMIRCRHIPYLRGARGGA